MTYYETYLLFIHHSQYSATFPGKYEKTRSPRHLLLLMNLFIINNIHFI